MGIRDSRLQGDEKLEVLPKPAGVRAELRPYQQYGYSWLHFAGNWGLGVILADDMGLGKTLQALTMIQRLKEEMGRLPAPILPVSYTHLDVYKRQLGMPAVAARTTAIESTFGSTISQSAARPSTCLPSLSSKRTSWSPTRPARMSC